MTRWSEARIHSSQNDLRLNPVMPGHQGPHHVALDVSENRRSDLTALFDNFGRQAVLDEFILDEDVDILGRRLEYVDEDQRIDLHF